MVFFPSVPTVDSSSVTKMRMKSLYLILVATTVVVMVVSEPQHSNNDIIWYPVDDEDGVFISTIGEKYRTTQQPKWRTHRFPRYSGPEPLPAPYDPAENYDPSFFHNIHERRPYASNTQITKVPPSFFNQQYPNFRPNKNSQPQGNQISNDNFQEIIIEVYDYNNRPPANGYPGSRPTTNQWNNRPVTGNQNQWGGNPFIGSNNQWGGGQRPASNQWGGTSGSLLNPGQRPAASNQWSGGQNSASNQWGGGQNSASNQWNGGQKPASNQWNGGQSSVSNQWGDTSGFLVNENPNQRPFPSNQWGSSTVSRPAERPTNSEWMVNPSNNVRPGGTKRPNQSDKLVFPGDPDISISTTPPSTTISIDLVPTDPPTRSPCEIMCPVTPEFNPVCGSDAVTYSNAGRLKCAQMCGKNVRLSHYGNCGRTPLVTPLVSNKPKQNFRGFW